MEPDINNNYPPEVDGAQCYWCTEYGIEEDDFDENGLPIHAACQKEQEWHEEKESEAEDLLGY